jgi:hypothetical protein
MREAGYKIEDLVVALTKIKIVVQNGTGGERHCLSFALGVVSEGELRKPNLTLLAEKRQSEEKIRNAERKAQNAEEQMSLLARPPRGAGRAFAETKAQGDKAGPR